MKIGWFISIIMAFASDTKLRIAIRKEGGARALVKQMNRRMDTMDFKGLQQLIRQHSKEAVVAGNYVIQSMLLEVLRGQE